MSQFLCVSVSFLSLYQCTMTPLVQGHDEGYVTSVSFSPDGSLIASGGADKTVRIWSFKDGALVQELKVDHHIEMEGGCGRETKIQLGEGRDGLYMNVLCVVCMNITCVRAWVCSAQLQKIPSSVS